MTAKAVKAKFFSTIVKESDAIKNLFKISENDKSLKNSLYLSPLPSLFYQSEIIADFKKVFTLRIYPSVSLNKMSWYATRFVYLKNNPSHI